MMRNVARGLIAFPLVIGLAACSSASSDRLNQPRHGPTSSSSSSSSSVRGFVSEGEETSPYPNDWRVDPATVVDRATFPVYLPSVPEANEANSIAAYVWPGNGAVALDFAAPAEPASYVIQSYLEIYESPWVGDDPLKDYEADINLDPVEGKSVIDIGGVPALVVKAHSPDAINQENAAFLRFVINGVEIQVSGGEDLDLLIEIAKSIVATGTRSE